MKVLKRNSNFTDSVWTHWLLLPFQTQKRKLTSCLASSCQSRTANLPYSLQQHLTALCRCLRYSQALKMAFDIHTHLYSSHYFLYRTTAVHKMWFAASSTATTGIFCFSCAISQLLFSICSFNPHAICYTKY